MTHNAYLLIYTLLRIYQDQIEAENEIQDKSLNLWQNYKYLF